nr:hypothetical protein [Tanacetum cinerariifolium]GEZ22026.1 hypothetical protein [Tanacetum cinerariifolium]
MDDFLVTENFGMILGQPVHTDDNVKTTEFNRHEINFKRHEKRLSLVVDYFQWLAFCFGSSWLNGPPCLREVTNESYNGKSCKLELALKMWEVLVLPWHRRERNGGRGQLGDQDLD